MSEAAIGIVFTSDRKGIVLVKRRDTPIWVLPGGGIEPGESADDAVKREVLEESGYHVKVIRPSGVYHPINRLSFMTYLFECMITHGEAQCSDETRDVQIFPLNSLPRDLFFVHRDWIDDALENRDRTVYLPIHQVTYRAFFLYSLKHPIQVTCYLWSFFIRKFFLSIE